MCKEHVQPYTFTLMPYTYNSIFWHTCFHKVFPSECCTFNICLISFNLLHLMVLKLRRYIPKLSINLCHSQLLHSIKCIRTHVQSVIVSTKKSHYQTQAIVKYFRKYFLYCTRDYFQDFITFLKVQSRNNITVHDL